MENLQKFSGIWHNPYGSEMKLEIDANGRVSGKFRTNIGRKEFKDLWTNTWYDIVGFANGDLISLAVNYESIGTLSVISGRFISKEKNKSQVNSIETNGFTSFNLLEEDQWRSRTISSITYQEGPAPV